MSTFTKKFESVKQEWATPWSLFNRLNAEFLFKVDLAADLSNCKLAFFYGPGGLVEDSLQMPWDLDGWLNPPYGQKDKAPLRQWVKKAFDESNKHGSTIVMLIPARTNTKWFHNYCMKAKELRFIEGRVVFEGADHGLPQPLCLVVFSPSNDPVKVSTFSL